MGGCLAGERLNVLGVKAAYEQRRPCMHAADVVPYVGKQNVAVYVGNDKVKAVALLEHVSSAKAHLNVGRAVEHNVLLGILKCKLVNVNGNNPLSAMLAGKYGKQGCAAAHVEYALALHVACEYCAQHVACGLVVACSECHFGVNEYVVFCFGHIGVECAVYYTVIAQYNGLEIVLFPLGVPVLALNELAVVCYCKARQGVRCHSAGNAFGIVKCVGNVGRHAVLFGDKALKAYFGKQCCQYICCSLLVGRYSEFYLCIVVHK